MMTRRTPRRSLDQSRRRRRRFLMVLAGLLLLLALPLFFSQPGQAPIPEAESLTPVSDLPVQLYDPVADEVKELLLEEYVAGVVAAEVPASFHPQALQAQAVAARTYAVRRLRLLGGTGCEQHLAADICADPAVSQAYLDADGQRAKWGPVRYWMLQRRIQEAVQATQGEILVYDGRPIDAVYHSTSGGHTESAAAVWGQEIPYLVGVPSPHEEDAPRFKSEIKMGLNELAARLNLSADAIRRRRQSGEDLFQITATGSSGRPTKVVVAGEEMPATQLRQQLDLPSTWFEYRWQADEVTFTVRGYGHGVGMSQYGAQGMAEAGSDYIEILAHYYPGAQHRPLFLE